MRQIPSDKYTIAWFKLAECVARGEREKAYGVYRLLSHSLLDQAYACKLEADLLVSFEDPRAAEKYEEAARYYMQEQRWYEAAGVYEQLKRMTNLTESMLQGMIRTHVGLRSQSYVIELVGMLVDQLLIKKDYARIQEVLATEIQQGALVDAHACYVSVLQKLIVAQAPEEVIISLLRTTLDLLIAEQDAKELTAFLAKLGSWKSYYRDVAQSLIS